ncbi:type II toxin-antitoxin system HicB family antitoxin [Rhizomonospora bruguierae]|uniref:type II toxin-antitoxin system HicB family antitoxin n=1 Tax=Rhizomonospora bruguierae TaxID=1581705 RepID=UPI001BCF3A46|nr:type II toxin-antitoxin system HicB family antitoxin [Micromonospora sp. NBRC 107566]
MDLTPYLDALRRDLAATAAPGGPEITRAADLLATSLAASARLALLEALSDAAAEITDRLGDASVEVRLRGREADFVVTELAPQTPPPATAVTPTDVSGDVSRITLRLPEPLKEAVEGLAAAEGVSVNAWLVRAVTSAVAYAASAPRPPGPPAPPTAPPPPGAPGRVRYGRRVTGFAQA